MPPTSTSIARIRTRAATAFLTERCTIEALQPQSGAVNTKPIWTVVVSDVPCRLTQLGQGDRPSVEMLSGQETLAEYYNLSIPYNRNISSDYRVQLNGIIYEIVRVESALTDSAFTQLIITRRRGQGS